MFVVKIFSVLLVLQFVTALDFNDLYEEDTEYYDYYEVTNDDSELPNRAKRYQEKASSRKTLSPEEVRNVKGALKDLLPNVETENPFTPFSQTTNRFESSDSTSDMSAPTTATNSETNILPTINMNTFKLTTVDHFGNATKKFPKRTSSHPKPTRRSDGLEMDIDAIKSLIDSRNEEYLRLSRPALNLATTVTTDTEGTTTSATRARSRELDIPRLMAIINELAGEFETNLTRKLNETLFNMSIPTCTTPTTEPPVTDEYDRNYTGSTIAKCFVCGLDVPRIPRHAHCADAFAGDFLPLVPVDPSAKGKISTFRKYCKYAKVRGYKTNSTRPRNIYGRWTGGCAVRWIDLSGIYTQRTCRNRLQPTMGKHFASKRMAKLERTLWNVENGCIVSPMATLVPLSRGVSLYARFHACVCTGSWCNAASANRQWTMYYLILSILRRIT